MWYVGDVLYVVLYVCASCFVVCECAVSRSYIHVCNCDMYNDVNVYLDHLKFCVLCTYIYIQWPQEKSSHGKNGRKIYMF